MVENKDLRVGNVVTDEFYDSFKNVIVVESMNGKGINLEIENSNDYPEMQSHWIKPYYEYEKLRGIPLTEEWLLKFGFLGYKKQYSLNIGGELNFYWRNGDVVLWVVGNGLTLDSVFRHKGSYNPSHVIEYVHQLQNLYFALTGEELTIR